MPKNHPHSGKLNDVLFQIVKLQKKDTPPNGDDTWVYELEGIGKNPDNLVCKSCSPQTTIWLENLFTYKYGTAKDIGGFQPSIESIYGRYPPGTKRAEFGIVDFNFNGVNRPNANIYAQKQVQNSIPESSALLLEKILIFNYALTRLQQPELILRGISTNYGLPPGNAIFR